MDGPHPARSPEHGPPNDPDTLLAMTTKWPKYPERPHRSNRARLTIGRKSFYLRGLWGSEESREHYEELYDRWRELRRKGGKSVAAVSLNVRDAVAECLSWVKLHLAASTHISYRQWGSAFAALYGDLLLSEIRPFHLTRWIDQKMAGGSWKSPSTPANVIRFLSAIFGWCKEQGLLASNPFAGMKRPRPRPRQRVLSEAEYRALLGGSHPALRRILRALWWTGARPKELRTATLDQVQYDAGRPIRIVQTEHKTSATQRTPKPRVIWCVGPLARIIVARRRQVERQSGGQVPPDTLIFLSPKGKPWTTHQLANLVRKKRRQLGLPEDVVPYLNRHSAITQALINGVDRSTAAALYGNSPAVIDANYAHVGANLGHLASAAAQAVRRPGRAG
jgi:integrase